MGLSAVALRVKQFVTSPSAGAGESILYPKTDGRWYTKHGTGAEIPIVDDLVVDEHAANVRSHMNATGGGTITVPTSYEIRWDTRFIIIANGYGPKFAASGYFDVTVPAVGTAIAGVGGASAVTVTSAGIPLASWHALYYILPIGSNNVSVPGNFRVASYTSTLSVPDTWVLIAVRNGDNGVVRFINGVTLYADQTSTPTNPYPQYAVSGHTHSGGGSSFTPEHYQVVASSATAPTSTTNLTIAGLSQQIVVPGPSAVYVVTLDADVSITTSGTLNIIEVLVNGAVRAEANAQLITQISTNGALGRISGSKTYRITDMPAGTYTITARTRNSAASTNATVQATHTRMTIQRVM